MTTSGIVLGVRVKHILLAGVNLRAPNGKADYKSASDFAKRELGISG